jgi:hypothetical protein
VRNRAKKMSNAFTIPAKGIQIRQQSEKQMRNNMTRVNQEQPSCVKTDLVKQLKLSKASI